MNRLNNNIYTASGVAHDKKVRLRALGRGACSKSNILPYKLTVTVNVSIHSLYVCGGKRGSAQYLYSS